MKTVIHESEVETLNLPGRALKWLIHPSQKISDKCSMNTVTINSGETVKPAHYHPNSEEVIYVVSGEGKVMIDNEVHIIKTGTTILFPQGSIHMVRNSGSEALKLICFFTSPVTLEDYKFYEDVPFLEDKK